MIKKIIASILFVCAQSSYADMPGCLAKTSNQDLINELGRRLLYQPFPNPYEPIDLQASFTCSDKMKVVMDLTNTTDGENSQTIISMANWDRCRQAADTLNEKIGSQNSIGKLFAICGDNMILHKLLISKVGKISVTKTSMSDWDKCYSAADKINNQ